MATSSLYPGGIDSFPADLHDWHADHTHIDDAVIAIQTALGTTGAPGSLLKSLPTISLPTDGVSDSAASFNSQATTLAAQGAGAVYVPWSANPYVCFSDLIVPAGLWVFGAGRLYGKYTGSTPGTVPANGAWNGTAFVPAPGNAGTFSRATMQLSKNSGVLQCSVFGQAHDGSQAPFALVATDKGTLTSACLIAGGSGAAFHGDAGSQGGKLLNNCYIDNAYTTSAYATPTLTSGGGTASLVVSSTTGIQVGALFHNYTRPTSVAAGTYVTAVNAGTNTVTLSATTSGGSASDALLFVSGASGGIYDSDWTVEAIETFSGPWEICAGDTKYSNCHFSDAGIAAGHNVIIDMGATQSSDATDCTIDSATTIAGHVLRIRGTVLWKNPRIQVGISSGSPFPFSQDVCADLTGFTAIQNATVPSLGSVHMSSLISYSGTVNSVSNGKAIAANVLDRITGTEAASSSFSSGWSLASGATFAGYARDNRLAGVVQPSVGLAAGVTQLASNSGTLTAGSANELSTMTTGTLQPGTYWVAVSVDMSGMTSTGHIDAYVGPSGVSGATLSGATIGNTVRYTSGVDAPISFAGAVTITAAGSLSVFVFPVSGMTGTIIVSAGNQAGATAFKVSQIAWQLVG